MKKKILLIGLLLTIVVTGCTYKYVNPDKTKFKEDYESLNGEALNDDVSYRVLALPTDHPFTYRTIEEVNEMLDNKESFIAFFCSNWDPWCRSMIITAIEKANEYEIEKIYYVDVRPDNIITNDIRDIYTKDESGNIKISHSGREAYRKFTKSLNNILKDYESRDISLKGTKYEGEHIIDTSTFIMVKNGKGIAVINGNSSLQTDPYMDLNYEIYKDMDKKFNEFFSLYK